MAIGVRANQDETYTALPDMGPPVTFTDPARLRAFVETYQALSAAYPGVPFTLADDAAMLTWGGPQPAPDPVATRVAYVASLDQQARDVVALRQQIVQAAQSAVGVAIGQLSIAQRNALIVLLLWKAGALNRDGTVKDLGEWVQ